MCGATTAEICSSGTHSDVIPAHGRGLMPVRRMNPQCSPFSQFGSPLRISRKPLFVVKVPEIASAALRGIEIAHCDIQTHRTVAHRWCVEFAGLYLQARV